MSSAKEIIVNGPFGAYPVAHEVVPLSDDTRLDPYAPSSSPHHRRILISVFYPLLPNYDYKVETVDLYSPKTQKVYSAISEAYGLSAHLYDNLKVQFHKPNKVEDVKKGCGVVIFSPGFTASRTSYTLQTKSLASRGYVVMTLDHPYETSIVEFPDGMVIHGMGPQDRSPETSKKAVQVRSKDISFVIDQLENPEPIGGRILAGCADMSKIFVYGHSLGGTAAAEAMFHDTRIKGGLNFDGRPVHLSPNVSLSRPFIAVGLPTPGREKSASEHWDKTLRGSKWFLSIKGTKHNSFMDMPLILAHRDDAPEKMKLVLKEFFGDVEGNHMAVVVDELLNMSVRVVFEGDEAGLRGLEGAFEEVEFEGQASERSKGATGSM